MPFWTKNLNFAALIIGGRVMLCITGAGYGNIPYVCYHLEEYAETPGPGLDSKVVDLGSAVTFFPCSVARLGYHVHCLDIDATCWPDIERAAVAVQHQPGEVDFRLISDGRFPHKDGEVDVVTHGV